MRSFGASGSVQPGAANTATSNTHLKRSHPMQASYLKAPDAGKNASKWRLEAEYAEASELALKPGDSLFQGRMSGH